MGMMPQGKGMTPPAMGMMPQGMGMTPPAMGMMPQGMGMTPPVMGMMPQGMGMTPIGMGGLGGMGMLGLMNFFGGGEDFMEDTRDQNSDDLGADEHLTSSKARLEKYLQKQWQLGKRKLQVQVDFGN